MSSYDISAVAQGVTVDKFISLAIESDKSWHVHNHTSPGTDHLLRDCWSSECYCGHSSVPVNTAQFNGLACGGTFHFLSIKAMIKGPFLPSFPLSIILCIIKLTVSAAFERLMWSVMYLLS